MATKISQLPELNTINGNETIPAVSGGNTVKFTLSKIKTIITKNDIALGNVDNTSDADKPISTATNAALDQKASLVHSHSVGNITGLQEALDGKAASSHGHDVSEITGIDTLIAGKADINHAHDVNSITGLASALDGKANTVHTHTKDQINGLNDDLVFIQSQINNKASSLHTHGVAEISGLDAAIDLKIAQAITSQPSGFTTDQIAAISVDAVGPLLLNKSDTGHGHTPEQIVGFDTAVNVLAVTAVENNQHVVVTNLEW